MTYTKHTIEIFLRVEVVDAEDEPWVERKSTLLGVRVAVLIERCAVVFVEIVREVVVELAIARCVMDDDRCGWEELETRRLTA